MTEIQYFCDKMKISIFFNFHSISRVSKMYESADFMYVIPPYRFTVYAIGILLGFCLQHFKNFNLSSYQLKLGWFASLNSLLATAAICTLNQNYTPLNDALFAGLASITINLFFAWIIFAAHLGNKSKNNENKLQSHNAFFLCRLFC